MTNKKHSRYLVPIAQDPYSRSKSGGIASIRHTEEVNIEHGITDMITVVALGRNISVTSLPSTPRTGRERGTIVSSVDLIFHDMIRIFESF